jgi:hypothetical protein
MNTVQSYTVEQQSPQNQGWNKLSQFAGLFLQLNQRPSVRMVPECFCCKRVERGKRFSGQPTIAVQFLENKFCSCDIGFRNGAVSAGDHSLQPLGFRKERGIRG